MNAQPFNTLQETGGDFLKVLVLCGGVSEEREVSLRSGARVAAALQKNGHTVVSFDVQEAMPRADLVQTCRAADAVFLCFHGGAGEDGRWQGALEAAGVRHYTGSDARASALAMDKPRAKACVSAIGVPVAKGAVWHVGEACPPLEYPFAAKPPCGGSSIGFCIVHGREEWEKLVPSGDLLCECYLPGAEYSVGVLQGRALPPVQIIPLGGTYDYAHKYTPDATREICPAPLSAKRLAALQNLALCSFCALGLRDFARVDFKEDEKGQPVFLEANTLPGMTQTSLLPLAAAARGICFEELCERMAQMAFSRKGNNT